MWIRRFTSALERLANCLRTHRPTTRKRFFCSEPVRTSWPSIPTIAKADVAILGGGTGGAPAAIGASRHNARTILIESSDALGGVGRVGQISRYWCGNRVGFTSEIDAAMADHPEHGSSSKASWSVSRKAAWYHNQCANGEVDLLFRSLCIGVRMSGNKVESLVVAHPYGVGMVSADNMIDATGCADIAALAGAPTRTIGPEHVAMQGTGLAGIVPGKDYFNSDHNFCDDSDVFDTTAFLVSAKVKFKDCFDAGQLVDSRERRQIIGELSLGPVDFLAERRYPDTICVASSNFDSHGYTIHDIFLCHPPDKKRLWADVPLRALLSPGIENIMTTGLGLSAHRDALPVVRMQADVQNHGYAAGCLAALATRQHLAIRSFPIRDVQQHLVGIGSLPERVLTDGDTFPVDDATISAAVAGDLTSFKNLAIIFANAQRAASHIQGALSENNDSQRTHQLSIISCLIGLAEGRGTIATYITNTPWDEGWNYRGMHQFGLSVSPLDAAIIAFSRVARHQDWDILIDKAGTLDAHPDFSHCRAIAEAFENLYKRHSDERAAHALKRLLDLPGMTGHHHDNMISVQAALTDDPN